MKISKDILNISQDQSRRCVSPKPQLSTVTLLWKWEIYGKHIGIWLSLHTSQVAHQAGAYPSLRSMKRLGVFLLPPGWDAGPSQGYPQH